METTTTTDRPATDRPSGELLPATMAVPEAAELLGISVRSAYRAAEADRIPVLRLGRRILVVRAKLYAMLGLDHGQSHEGAARERLNPPGRDVAPGAQCRTAPTPRECPFTALTGVSAHLSPGSGLV
jgi:excisionase family DNA binding protein